MDTIVVRSLERLQVLAVAGQHALVGDESPPEGDGLGPNPYELLLAALGA